VRNSASTPTLSTCCARVLMEGGQSYKMWRKKKKKKVDPGVIFAETLVGSC
jgi:hypothetical protein